MMDLNRMKVGCAAIFQSKELSECLLNESSIYSAEVTTIGLVMNIITNHKSSKFVIYSDSKSILFALQYKNISNSLIKKLINEMNTFQK